MCIVFGGTLLVFALYYRDGANVPCYNRKKQKKNIPILQPHDKLDNALYRPKSVT